MKKQRRKLSDVLPPKVELSPEAIAQRKRDRKSVPDIPDFLDRRKWTDEDHERNRRAWNKITADERERVHKINQRIFAAVKRERQKKKIKQIKSDERAHLKADRRARRIRRMQQNEDHDQRVLDALKYGCDTSGKINKRTRIETRLIRRSLKRLIKAGRVKKLGSSRRYSLVTQKRRRLSDVVKK